MKRTTSIFSDSRGIYIAVIGIMLGVAFYACYRTTYDLNWTSASDFDRDIAFIHGNLEGNFGKDPNYVGEWLWYNPLLFSIETFLVKITGLPVNVIVTRAGVYLNVLAPLAFLTMMWVFFDKKIATAGLLAFLFLSTNGIPGWSSATFSPWLYPVCFVQFIFYLNLIFFYLAFETRSFIWFLILGIGLGFSFLGHLAPTLIAIGIVAEIMLFEFFRLYRLKDWGGMKKTGLLASVSAIAFLIVASPLLYYIAGKYHMHYVNRRPFELEDNQTNIFYLGGILKRNFSPALIVSLVGLWWFFRFFQKPLLRKIILNWWVISGILYLYSSLVPFISRNYGILLPGSVPAFHYFFYLKSLQSVFFPFGLIFLGKKLWTWLHRAWPGSWQVLNGTGSNPFFAAAILLIMVGDLPFYFKGEDFKLARKLAMGIAADTNKIAVYTFLLEHIPSDKVILCDQENSIFPVMASERKMVSGLSTFSNPFIDYNTREHDRTAMLNFLIHGAPASATQLFKKYQVNYILLNSNDVIELEKRMPLPGRLVYKNANYVILSIDDYQSSAIKPILPRV